jgi:hypothetical protein
LGPFELDGTLVHVVEQPCSGPEHHRNEVDDDLADEPGHQVLIDDVRSPRDHHGLSVGHRLGLVEGGLYAIGHE